MPELPEVETISRDLRLKIVGHCIERAEVFWEREVSYPSVPEFLELISNRRIEGTDRRAKYVVIRLSENATLLVHLKMTGQLLYVPAGEPPNAYTRVLLHLDRGMQLRFVDVRKFGRMYLVEADRLQDFPKIAELGPEPLEAAFTPRAFQSLLKRRTGRIKPLLMNQGFLAGMGNIYVDEALFRSGLHPLHSSAALKAKDTARLHQAIIDVLEESIANRGSSIDDYRDPAGQKGYHHVHLRVYGRGGQPCLVCGTPIAKIVVGGRGTHFCPRCQREHKVRRKPGPRQHSADITVGDSRSRRRLQRST
ncbi:MAG TPA: bifunctional DNA-formamidopyrimidine glycosylase/DNA-(apurinic or apyrimidinic site) lyase [Chloroflexota bacterium]|nr:bifunctional DNA-formamidopyrimidine glycosylase/DNA-(apurinic or apyrimidinic site) lyase [Chloroflexota bacterium]